MIGARRFLVPALAFLVCALSLCATLGPPAVARATTCPLSAVATGPCCPDEGENSCPVPDRAPARDTCRTCDGSVRLVPASRKTVLSAPALSRLEPVLVHAASTLRDCGARRRLAAVNAAPPAHLLLSTLRN